MFAVRLPGALADTALLKPEGPCGAGAQGGEGSSAEDLCIPSVPRELLVPVLKKPFLSRKQRCANNL